MASGIYQIMNQMNGKCYIGSAVDVKRRWSQHRRCLRRGRHHNLHLQRAFDRYGESAFTLTVLEHIEESRWLITREQHFLDRLNPAYNIVPTAGSLLGYRHTKETRRKMSGDQHPAYGKHLSAEHRRNLSEAQKGDRGNNYGKHASKETRRKLSKALMGHQVSEAVRKKISETLKGRSLTVEHRRKLSEAAKAYHRRVHAIENALKESRDDRPQRSHRQGEGVDAHRGVLLAQS